MYVWCVGVWLCPSHHCHECGRTATLSCAFCPMAFCSEHHHNNIRLTEYYQLACLRHNDVVICEDPSVLKIFGLTKSTKLSSSRKSTHRKSGDGLKRIRMDDDRAGKLDPESKNRVDRHKRKSITLLPEPREQGPKRSCRDRDVKKTELEQSLSKDDNFSALLGKNRDNGLKQRDKKKELQPPEKRKKDEPGESKTEQMRSQCSDHKTANSGTSQGSLHSKKGSRTSDPVTNSDHHRHSVSKDETHAQNSKKKGKTFFSNGSQHRTGKKGVDHLAQKRRHEKELTERSETSTLSFLSAPKGQSLSSLVPSSLSSRTSGVDMRGAKSAVASSESLAVEQLFDNSDDEFPELVIDVPTI